jgi:predicted Co/Zn/Cd cation transporter (cation efflux family)
MTMPANLDLPPKTRGLTAIGGAMALIAVLLIVQIWLLSAALESFLAGNHRTALPAAIFSGVMFLICFGLYLFVRRVDSDVRQSGDQR